ncbi:MAG TPA: PHP domain-containing protein [Candidatus Rifleibacterium sp.]|nr:PHP domain-containing protein [Candidatus Rifleibacterium sp.]
MQKQNRNQQFVHLHVHSEYSIMESPATVRQIVDAAVRHQMPAIALTDYNSLAGANEFASYARQRGIKPIFGCEVNLSPDEGWQMNKTRRHRHLTLLARNRRGWRNLCELTKCRLANGRPEAQIDFALLEKHSAGLIGLSGCLAGEVAMYLLADERKKAELAIARYLAIFGKGNFYIELQNHWLHEQRKLLPELVSLAGEYDCPIVATNDIHYISRKDHALHDAMLCLKTGARIADRQRFNFPTMEFYCKSGKEMQKVFKEWPQALAETVKIARRCNVSILPEKIAAPEPLELNSRKPEAELAEMCQKGLIRRFGSIAPEPKIFDRLQAELATIRVRGVSEIFVTIAGMIASAQTAGIRTWPCPGKACASLVNYLLGITEVNPMLHGQGFEAFLSSEDRRGLYFKILCSDNRQFMIRYLQKRFGTSRIVNASRCNRWYADSIIREIAKIIDVPHLEAQRVINATIEAPGRTLREKIRESSLINSLGRSRNPMMRKFLQLAVGLENSIREILPGNTTVISPKKIEESLPVLLTETNAMITQFNSDSLNDAGFFLVEISEFEDPAINLKTL